jgi:thiol-disulfide isomerase/thioredoxin
MIGAHGETYTQAHRLTTRTGRPMVVLVGAEWCPACKVMKDTVIPAVKKRGGLNKVSFAVVDIDEEKELGKTLINRGPIPQLLMYRRTPLGWRLRRIVGGQSVKSVETFVETGIKLDEAAKSGQEQKTESQEEPSLVPQKRPASLTTTQ